MVSCSDTIVSNHETVTTMSRLSRWLRFVRRSPWRLNGSEERRWLAILRQPVRRAWPGIESLEDRVVPTLLGQQIFPADYPWNQNISNAPVAGNSAAIINHIGGSIGIHPDWGEDMPAMEIAHSTGFRSTWSMATVRGR